mmetsp:Transcript_20423/g.47464  ORF Transcript_20423/g.47464 Transcript_20423/m.47464 type:complete len:339 (+) Transcript_20423:128-1144(+)
MVALKTLLFVTAMALGALAQPRLHLDDGTYKIVQFADLHFGEGESEAWGPRADRKTLAFLTSAMKHEAPVSHVVLSGDQVTGLNIDANATDYYDEIIGVFSDSTPHTTILGNHDAEPQTGDQGDPGAKTNRTALMLHDMATPLSYSKPNLDLANGAVSAYIVDVYESAESDTVALQLIHLDSGGGGMPETIYDDQVAWLQAQLDARADPSVPMLLFIHIPFAESQVALDEGDECFGVNNDGVTPTTDDAGLFDLIAKEPSILATFSGHDHCNDFCCAYNGQHLCFGRHSSYGGYSCSGMAHEHGVRVIEFTRSDEGEVGLSTWVRMELGNKAEEHALV